jgi:hypothetical protein
MILRQHLNGLQPRTARELWRNPLDWWETSEPEFVVQTIDTKPSLLRRFVRFFVDLAAALRKG